VMQQSPFPPAIDLPAEYLELDGVRHWAERAEGLIAKGGPDDLALAERLLEATLACQERRPGAINRGNFLWRRQDDAIRDVNAVEFILKFLIPIMIEHSDRLSPGLRDRLTQGIRDGLDAIRTMDVAVDYTNIAVMDCMNTCLGGELLNDAAIAERGYAKLRRWADKVAANGTIFEFDSPGYMVVTLEALHRIARYVRDEETGILARAVAARLGLGSALHIHASTGYWAGPHSRAYHPTVIAAGPPEVGELHRLIGEGALPGWVAHALERPVLPMSVHETSSREWQIGSTAYHTPSYAMGTASREVSWQTDVFTVHYNIPGSERPGVVYSRYLLDDTWFEEDPARRDRSNARRLVESGKFYGVQDGPRMLGLYTPKTIENFVSFAPCSRDIFASAKAALVWAQAASVDAIWAGSRRIESLPAEVPAGEVIVVACGDIYLAVRPLTRTELGYASPIRLREFEGELLLELYNYLGPSKGHHQLERGSRFYQGQAQNGFYAEVAERTAYPDGPAFAKAVAGGTLRDEAAPPFTAYRDYPPRPWVVEYSRDGRSLGIEVDLMMWELRRRWTHEKELGWPMLESPTAAQNATGRVEVGGGALECGPAPAWLFGDAAGDVWAAGYHGAPHPLVLTLPNGRVELEAMGTGTVTWIQGAVTVDAMGVRGTPRFARGSGA
jgi:hypothetical protein